MDETTLRDGCRNCPVKECDIAYRGSSCAARRSRAGVDFDPITHSEQIRRAGIKELENFLFDISASGSHPWCKKAETISKGGLCEAEGEGCRKCIADWLSRPVCDDNQ